jgi:hypothetical protein
MKIGWWPDPTKKDFVQCIFCMKVVPSGIKRFKHLAGGFGSIEMNLPRFRGCFRSLYKYI